MKSLYTALTKLGVVVLILVMTTVAVKAQKIAFPDAWNKNGITLLAHDRSTVSIGYSMTGFTMASADINGRQMMNLEVPGFWLPNDAGAPNLPGGGRLIAIPEGATASVNILSLRKETYRNVEVAPAPRIPLDSDKGPLQYPERNEIYGKNAFYPTSSVSLSPVIQIRGVDAVMVGITPFQYNPVTKELIVYRDMEISVTITGGNGQIGEERLRSRFWDPILEDALLNSEVLPVVDYGARASRSSDGCEYLIIVPDSDDYMTYAEQIRNFRIRQGITTDIVTLSEIGGNTVSTIETYINNAYNSWDPAPSAILLIGDYGSNQEINITAPIWDAYCASDNIWGDVDGDDLPDIVMARMTANNTDQLETFVSKFINYETSPPTSAGFYDHPITALGWQTERWFQLCSEIVGGYFKNVHGKNPVRINEIYAGNPGSDPWSTAQNTSTILAEFGPDGLGYIPATPQELGNWSGGNATAINNAINSGAFILQHRDHGGETGWGEPQYQNSDINGLTNSDLTFVFSINCLTGKYNWSNECFTEKFHRYQYNNQNSGALGLTGASETSYSFVNDTYVWGLMDNLWPDFMPAYGTNPPSRGMLPAFGNAAGKYFLWQSGWPYNGGEKTVTYHLFHHHGDAFLQLYSEVPQELTLLHDGVVLAGMNQFPITATQGSTICLTVDDEIIALVTGTGSLQVVEIIPQMPGTNIVLTVTKENYFRHEEVLQVIPAEGPYCIYNHHIVQDTAGNGNGIAEYNETVGLNLEMRNVGLDEGFDVLVTLTTSDPFISLIDAEEGYGNIAPGGTVSVPGAFTFHVAENVPDQHKAIFSLTASDSANTWNSSFLVPVNAPWLNIKTLSINDQANGNGNGQLDPGETVAMTVNYTNTGHATAYDVDIHMEGQSGFVEIENPDQNFSFIGFLGQFNKTFNVTVDEDTPEGILVNFVNEMTMGSYFQSKTFPLNISAICEDFETGDFTKFEWEDGGNLPWTIISIYPLEGLFSARSGDISASQTSTLELSYEVMATDSITFYRKISSAEGDELRFYIGSTLMGSWSGSKSWARIAYEVTPGMKEFRWVYSKNSSGDAGSDCAWIDKIIFPSPMALTLWAGPDAEICPGGSFLLNEAYGTDYSAVEWSTSGTGVFTDFTLVKSEYNPSPEDIAAGQVVLTLTLWNSEGDSVSDAMTLGFTATPEAPAMAEGPDYVDLYSVTVSEYTSTGLAGITDYAWTLEPAEAGTIEGGSLTGTVTWNTTFLGTAYVSVAGINDCGTGAFSEALEVTLDNTVSLPENGLDGLSIRAIPNPSDGMFRVEICSKTDQKVNLRILNILGQTVYAENLEIRGTLSRDIHLQDGHSGLYFLVAEGHGTSSGINIIIR